MQDGPGVGLICRLRFLLCVTEADQGAQVITTRCKAQKPIMEQKDDQSYNHYKHQETHSSRNHSGKSNEPKGPSGEVYNRVPHVRDEHRKSTKQHYGSSITEATFTEVKLPKEDYRS